MFDSKYWELVDNIRAFRTQSGTREIADSVDKLLSMIMDIYSELQELKMEMQHSEEERDIRDFG